MIAEQPKKIPHLARSIYDSATGNFGAIKEKNCTWTSCRESLHDYVDSPAATYGYIKGYYAYNIAGNTIEKLDRFMSRMEAVLGLTTPSVFHRIEVEEKTELMGLTVKTETKVLDSVICVEPSAWWRAAYKNGQMRHQFWTCCLRAALAYSEEQDNWWQALFTYEYFQPTLQAVARFMDGYTHYTGERVGWYTTFRDYNAIGSGTTLAMLLIKPPA